MQTKLFKKKSSTTLVINPNTGVSLSTNEINIPYSDVEFEIKLNNDNCLIEKVEFIRYETNEKSIVLDTKKLKYSYIIPDKQDEYIKNTYSLLTDKSSYNNISRILFEKQQEGNISIFIPLKLLFNTQNSSFAPKFKIEIKYKILTFVSGLFYQKFFNEKLDNNFEIIYTSNKYFSNTNWLPCNYSLSNQIKWKFRNYRWCCC